MRGNPPYAGGMRTAFRLAAVVGIAAIAVGSLAACAPSSSTPLRIGVEGPLTGAQAPTGAGMLNGAQLAADEINAAGGVGGRQIEIVPIDDAADPDTGVAAATAAIKDGLDVVVGPYNSGVGLKTLPLYEQAGIVPMRLTSNSKTNLMGFTLQPMDYQIAPVAATALTKWKGAKTVAIIYDQTAEYTSSIATTLKQQLESDGASVPVFTPITPGTTDVAAAVLQASQAGVDVIYGATYFPEGALIATAMHDQKIAQPCVLDYGSDDPGYITSVGSISVAESCAVVGVPSPTDFPDGGAFVNNYNAAFKQDPGTWSPYTYDSVKLLVDAITSTGTTKASPLREFLNKVAGWKGVTGSVTIDPANGNRDPATVVVLDVTENGQFHVDGEWASAVGAPF